MKPTTPIYILSGCAVVAGSLLTVTVLSGDVSGLDITPTEQPIETVVVTETVLIPGPKGDKGDKGEQGFTGFRGLQGEQGVPGTDGQDGKDGAAIVGPQGLPGRDGQSIVGPAGRDGEDGEDSQVPGPVGPKGDKGDQGDQGPPGPFCPEGFVLTEISLHQRAPIDQDLPVTVCVVAP